MELPDGSVHENFHRIVLPEFAVTVALTTDGRFVMIREYKHGAEGVCLNAPAGMIAAGEAPLAAARRELLEETGYTAVAWRRLGSFVVDGTNGGGRAHLFLAGGAERVSAPRLDENEEIEVVLFDKTALRAALASGEIPLLPSACALGLAFLVLGD